MSEKKVFVYIFNVDNFHFSLPCKIGAVQLVSVREPIFISADFYFGRLHTFWRDLVLDAPWENSDVLPTTLRNFRRYFSWICPSRGEFIFHLQAEIFILQELEKVFNGSILFKEL